MDFIGYLQGKEREKMEMLFRSCPDEVLEYMTIRKAAKGEIFIRAGDPCQNVYILLKGKAHGMGMPLEEKVYVFRSFTSGRILGELECFLDQKVYSASIQAVMPCVMARIPMKMWRSWMEKDPKALYMRSQTIIGELTDQLKDGRKYLFLSCYDRIQLYLIDRYEKGGSAGNFQVKKTRPELAEILGFSIKTINRTASKLQKNGLIHIVHGKITVSTAQIQKMQKYCEEHYLITDALL